MKKKKTHRSVWYILLTKSQHCWRTNGIFKLLSSTEKDWYYRAI